MPSGVTSSDGSRCRFFAQAAPTSTSSTTATSAPALSSSRSVTGDGEGVTVGLPLPEGALEAWQPPLGPPWNWICRRLFRPRQHATCKPARSKVNEEAVGRTFLASQLPSPREPARPIAARPCALKTPWNSHPFRIVSCITIGSTYPCAQQRPEIPCALRDLHQSRPKGCEGGRRGLGLRTGPTPGPSSGDIQNTAPLLMLIPASSFHSCAQSSSRESMICRQLKPKDCASRDRYSRQS